MKPQNTQQQMILILGFVFLVVGISMLSSSRGGGIAFIALAVVTFMMSLPRRRR